MLTSKFLDAFFRDGWNRHDVDVLMTFMSNDCVFESTAGPEVCGTRHAGRERVREAFARVFKAFPDATFADARHFVAGDRGVSELDLPGHGRRRQEGRGQRLRRLHLRRRQDRGEELLLQEPDGVSGRGGRPGPSRIITAASACSVAQAPSASASPPTRSRMTPTSEGPKANVN